VKESAATALQKVLFALPLFLSTETQTGAVSIHGRVESFQKLSHFGR